MNDSAADLADLPLEAAEAVSESPADLAPPAGKPAPRPRYRPSEAWALRWLGPASRG